MKMTEPRAFTVNRLVVLGSVLFLLGLVMSLNATQEHEQDEAFTLMREGASEILSGLLVAFPSIKRRCGHAKR